MTHNPTELPADVNDLITAEALENFGQLASGGEFQRGSKRLRSRLQELTVGELFHRPPVNLTMADCCLSGIWLLHGFLDQSHEISQSIKAAEGGWWHGIMHRLEGDFWNSKYWYRQVGAHAVLQQISESQPGFPNQFVDAAESAVENGGDQQVAQVAIQEWVMLFNHCHQQASAL